MHNSHLPMMLENVQIFETHAVFFLFLQIRITYVAHNFDTQEQL